MNFFAVNYNSPWRFIYQIQTLYNYLHYLFLCLPHMKYHQISKLHFASYKHLISLDTSLWYTFVWADCPVSSSKVCLILTIRQRERGSPWFFRLVKSCIFTWSWEICDYKANFAPPYLKGFSLRVLTCVTYFCLKICRGQRSQWAMNISVWE